MFNVSAEGQHVFSYMDESIQSPQEDQAYYVSHSKLLLIICFPMENMLRDDTINRAEVAI